MTKSNLPKSTRKFIRLEKARIRAQFFDFIKQEEMIKELYNKFISQPIVEIKKEVKEEVKKTKVRKVEKAEKASSKKNVKYEKKHNKA